MKSYFKEVAPQWDTMRQDYFTEEVGTAAIARAKLTPASVVADVGTGTGFMLAGLAPLVGKAYGFDNSAEMLEVARKNLGDAANVELTGLGGASLPLPDGQLDAVFANMYLHHAPDPAAAIAEMARVLRPGGRLVITDLDPHTHEWMAKEMADLWLGFERNQVEAWYNSARLADVKVECTGSDCCGSSSSGDLGHDQRLRRQRHQGVEGGRGGKHQDGSRRRGHREGQGDLRRHQGHPRHRFRAQSLQGDGLRTRSYLEANWNKVKAVMVRQGKLDRLTKEIIAVAVSAVNGCGY